MQNITSTFTKTGGILVFLIMEAICLGLVVTFNQGQQEIYQNSKNIFADSMINGWDGITEYWYLSSVNDSLAGVIADLRAEQDEAKFQNSIWRDSLRERRDNFEQQYIYTEAKVVDNTITLPNNYLILNRGVKHGINTQMGVFDDNGIVGIVVGSNNRYSKVMSILHKDLKISAEVKRLKAFGTLVWENTANPTIMNLKYIPKHIHPVIGDTIQTSGYSSHFPEGIMIGTIKEIVDDNQGSNFRTLKVKLSNDISTTRYVYIVNNLFKEELKEIEEGKENE